LPDIALISFVYSISPSPSAQSAGVGESTRSRLFLGTNRAPRTFTDRRISSAIQRLTVLSESPVKRVMSSAAKIRRRPSFAILRMGLLSRASWFRGRVSEKVPGSLTRQQPHECDQRIGHRRPAALKGR
jgi:hypothetical protein